jgi:oxepin-CoA hydrolase/3-oxo-5,6-dehydrosuberyl-CoA semialdehyde dehydrogenase
MEQQVNNTVFIRQTLFDLLGNLQPQRKNLWGKMNAQQMVEHLMLFFDVSSCKIVYPLLTDPENLPKFKAFLYSDKAFRENTKAPETLLPEEPIPVHTENLNAAIGILKQSVEDFFLYFKADTTKTTTHPVFGALNYEEWMMLHTKHIQHHLRQFGMI